MAWTNSNYSVLPWYDSISRQQHRKSYAQGQVFPLYSDIQKIPPFQVVKTTALATAVSNVSIVRIATGVTTNITSSMVGAGLISTQFTGYTIISFPGIDALTDVTIGEGQWYLTMTDGTNTWYSEIFCVVSNISSLLKISFWHDEPFMIPGGHISYADPFQNFIYLNTEINRPEYPYEEELSDRDGYRFPIYSISKKTYFFNYMMPEYMIDVMRLIPQHHFVVIEKDGITYNVTYLNITPQGWQGSNHLNNVEFEFDTDTVVQVTGKIKPETEGHSYDQQAYDDSHL